MERCHWSSLTEICLKLQMTRVINTIIDTVTLQIPNLHFANNYYVTIQMELCNWLEVFREYQWRSLISLDSGPVYILYDGRVNFTGSAIFFITS